MTIKQRPDSLAPQCRALSALQLPEGARQRAVVDREARTLTVAFASETPVDMWYGTEILSMAPGAMRTGVRQLTLPVLFNHCRDDLLGVVERLWVDTDRVARAVIRFGKDERGEWAMNQADDGVLVNVSFMYRVYRFIEDTEAETLTAIDWEPYELTLCTMPADPTVGAGRSADAHTENSVQIEALAGTRAAAATTPAHAPEGAAPGVSSAPGAHSLPTNSALQGETMPIRRIQPHRLQEQAEAATSAGGTGLQVSSVQNGHTPPGDAAGARGAEWERARITEIEAICRKYNLSDDLRRSLVTNNATADMARLAAADVVLERSRAASSPVADFGSTHNPDLSTREKARYSMMRAVRAALENKWEGAGFELECSNEIARQLGRGPQNERGFFIPTNISFAQRATLTVGTPGAGTSGGTLVATNLQTGSFIEVLRNRARTMQLGATVLSGLVGAVDIPRQTGQVSTYWASETGTVTQSEPTFDKVSLNMKTIGTFAQVTRNMLMQSTPDIDMLLRADLMAAIALGVDLAALSGSGSSNQPLGIANQSGIGSVVGGTNGANISIDNYIDLETQVTAANVPEESLAYLTGAKAVGSTKKLKSTTGQYLWTDAPGGGRSGTPGEINGYPVARSNQARSNLTKGTSSGVCSEIFFGAWNELLIGEWGVVEIVPNPYAAAVFAGGGVLLRVLQSVDIAVRHAASFAVMSDALTP